MKNFLKCSILPIAIFLGIVLLFSGVMSIITLKTEVHIPLLVTLLVSFLAFFTGGLVFGLINKKQGFIKALLLSTAYILILLIYYMFIEKTKLIWTDYLSYLGRIVLLTFGSILGVNISNSKKSK